MSTKIKTIATKEDGKATLTPKLRFPEFRDAGAWTTETLGSVAAISTEKVGDNTCIPMSITSGVGLVSQMEKFGRIIAGSSYKNYLLLKKNDFAYNKSATKEYPEGFIALYSGDELAAVPNSIFTCFRIKGDSPAPQYLNYLLLGNLHGQWLRKFIEVGARAHGSLSVDEDDLLALPVPLPQGETSLHEQQKIAECLSSVDELIAAEARKLDALKTHKKGLMQQLFPREGETQPRLRFPEFQTAGEWEEVHFGKLGLDVSDGNYSSKYPSQSDFVEAGVPFLRANNLKFGTVSDADMRFISPQQHSQITKGHLKKGDILITTRGELGIIALVPDRHIGSNINAQIVRINAGNRLVNTFLFHLMDYSRTIGLFDALSTGTALKQLPIGKLNQLSLKIPETPAEQQRIADCLTSVDDLIAAQTQKLGALKTHKKGLMQQLFPTV